MTLKEVTYQPQIDGLRGIAVVLVLLYHAHLGFPGGFVGVDVFFVISGYLITGLLLRDLANNQFSIVAFWERRVRRIMPAVAVVVLACVLAGWFLLLPQDFKRLGYSALAQAMLISNVYFWAGTGYFEGPSEAKPLLHTWSLAVEEQFYLLFPFLLFALRRWSRRNLALALAALCGGSLSLSVWQTFTHPSTSFYLLPSRAWELLLGAVLAVRPWEGSFPGRLADAVSLGGLLSVLASALLYDHTTRFPGLSAVPPCAGTALLILANERNRTLVGRLLASRVFVFFGLISYSLYLWHFPLLAFVRYGAAAPLSHGEAIVMLLSSVALAVLSWKFVETPVRRRMILKARPQIFAFAGGTTALVASAGFLIASLHGLPSRVPVRVLPYCNAQMDSVFERNLSLDEALRGDFVQYGVHDTNSPIRLFVWGDSHAMAVLSMLDSLCKEYGVRGLAGMRLGVAPVLGPEHAGTNEKTDEVVATKNAIIQFVRGQKVANVLLIANWGRYIDSDGGGERLRWRMMETISSLREAGATVWVMRQVPTQRWNISQLVALSVWRGTDPGEAGCSLAEHEKELERQNLLFKDLSGRFPGVRVLDPTQCFAGGAGRCRVVEGGRPLYWDANHLTVAGAVVLRPLFEPIVKDIGERHLPGEALPGSMSTSTGG